MLSVLPIWRRGSIVGVMAGRLALVVGSECAVRGKSEDFKPAPLAAGLNEALTRAGVWRSPVASRGPLLDPTLDQLQQAVTAAFEEANDLKATLLIAFVGHGMSTGAQDFHLMCSDSPARPNPESAFHLSESIRWRIDRNQKMDGLIVQVDACEAGEGVQGAAQRWVDVLRMDGRMELLVASSDSAAYAGCFTSTLTDTLMAGLPQAGEHLLCVDVIPTLTASCERQVPQHLSFASGAGVSEVGDAGLWLVPNIARISDAVTGLASAGLVDELTRGLIQTDTLRETLAEVIENDSSRLRLVFGSVGVGKSTLMSVLIRPALVDTLDVTAGYISAAIFLDKTSNIQTLTEVLVAQLEKRIPGFAAARARIATEPPDEAQASADSFEVDLLRPLERCQQPGRRIRLLIDGLDQPEAGSQALILSAIARITAAERVALGHIKLIVSTRAGVGVEDSPELAEAHRIEVRTPTLLDAVGETDASTLLMVTAMMHDFETSGEGEFTDWFAGSGWLIPRLVIGIDDWEGGDLVGLVGARLDQALGHGATSDETLAILALLLASGAGPVLPIALLGLALQDSGHILGLAQIRDVLVGLGALVSRGRPGQDVERVGIANDTIGDALAADPRLNDGVVTAAHRALADALREHASTEKAPSELKEYAASAGPRHLLVSGDGTGAVKALMSQDSSRALDNLERWASWLPAFQTILGPDHPDTLATRGNLAYWQGEAGDPAGAAAALEELLVDRLRVLGQDHPDTLATRVSLAHWRGRADDAETRKPER
jgi:hypothetical protein